MKILVNNEEYSLPERSTLGTAIRKIMPAKKYFGVAIAVNMHIIAQDLWDGYELKEKDVLLVIKATQGG